MVLSLLTINLLGPASSQVAGLLVDKSSQKVHGGLDRRPFPGSYTLVLQCVEWNSCWINNTIFLSLQIIIIWRTHPAKRAVTLWVQGPTTWAPTGHPRPLEGPQQTARRYPAVPGWLSVDSPMAQTWQGRSCQADLSVQRHRLGGLLATKVKWINHMLTNLVFNSITWLLSLIESKLPVRIK